MGPIELSDDLVLDAPPRSGAVKAFNLCGSMPLEATDATVGPRDTLSGGMDRSVEVLRSRSGRIWESVLSNPPAVLSAER